MATTSLITGRVPLPSDDPISYAELTFTLSGLDSEGADVFLPGISKRVVLVDSEIPTGFDLWRNTEGYRGTNYKVLARWVEVTRDGKRDRYAELPAVQVGDEASYTLAELLMSVPFPTPETRYWMSITEDAYNTAIAAVATTAANAASADASAASASASAAAAAATLANAALKSANLSDMASKPTALTNLRGYTATATAAGTTTLTAVSTLGQRFTGVTTQTIVLPVTTTLALGWEFTIENASTGALTVNSSGGNLVATIPAGVTARIKCILASGTTAASWSLAFSGFQTAFIRTFVTPRDYVASAGTGGDDTAAVAAAMASDLPMYIDRAYIISAAVTHSTSAAKMVYGDGPSTSRITITNATQDGLVKTGGGSLTVESISVTTSINKTAGAAVKTSGTYKDIIRDCHIFGPSTSLKLFVGIDINGLIPCVENNYILTCTNIGLKINNTTSGEGSEGIVSGNTFNTAQPSNTAIAINWTSGLRTLRVFANTFQNYAYGMNVAPATGYTPMSLDFFGNVLELNSVGGLVCTLPGGSATIMDVVMINGNQFNESTGAAIILTGATNFIRIVNITGNVFDMGSTGQLSLWNGGNVNICSNTFVSANPAHIPIQLSASLPVATFIGSNNSLALTTLYAKNGNTGAYKAAAIVAA